MIERTRGLLVVGLIAAILMPAGCGRRETAAALRTPHAVVDRLGNQRTYRLFLPRMGKKTLPLLVYFHGVRSPGFRNIPTLKKYTGAPVEETGLIPFCRANGIMLLVPDALYEYQFLGCTAKGWVIAKEIDGIEGMIDAVVKHYPVSKREIYLAGLSAGAVFCHFLANRRPDYYNGLVSHSQAYTSDQGEILQPALPGPRFGVVFAYNRKDYANLVAFCLESERIYRRAGYRTALLKDLLPEGHQWSAENNRRFWRLLQKLGRQP
jgi:pimeloyl-ACP methyl ester carboxylesterase